MFVVRTSIYRSHLGTPNWHHSISMKPPIYLRIPSLYLPLPFPLPFPPISSAAEWDREHPTIEPSSGGGAVVAQRAPEAAEGINNYERRRRLKDGRWKEGSHGNGINSFICDKKSCEATIIYTKTQMYMYGCTCTRTYAWIRIYIHTCIYMYT